MMIRFDNCLVSDVFHGQARDSGTPFCIMTFFEPDSCHEYKVFVPDAQAAAVDAIPQRSPVSLYFELTQGQRQALVVQYAAWEKGQQ